MKNVTVFVDTMIFLHFKPLEEVDWRALFGADRVDLIVTRVVTRELDRHKNTHSSPKIRDRARRALQRIETWAGQDTVLREGVGVVVLANLPTQDIRLLGLNADWPDDVQLAIALEIANASPNALVTILSDDTAARVRARQAGVEAVAPNEEHRLPVEVDPLEAENRQLAKRLQEMTASAPLLELLIGDGEKHIKIKQPSPFMKDISERTRLMAEERKKYSAYSTKNIDRGLLGINFPTQDEISRYNRELEAYFGRYASWLEEKELWNRAIALRYEFYPKLLNRGGAPAEDIDVEMHFPDGFALLGQEDIDEEPKRPRPPQSPRSSGQMLMDNMSFSSRMPLMDYPGLRGPIAPPNISGPSIKPSKSYDVHFSVGRLKHGFEAPLGPLFVQFDEPEALFSFEVQYRINAGNMPKDVEGVLRVAAET